MEKATYKSIDIRSAKSVLGLFIIIGVGILLSDQGFMYGGIRIVFHVLAAIFITLYLNNLYGLALHKLQKYLELWSWIVISNNKLRRGILISLRLFVAIAIMLLPAITYGIFCYNWESGQAADYQRAIQYSQLITDELTIIVTSYAIFKFTISQSKYPPEDYWIRKYFSKKEDAKKKMEDLLIYFEYLKTEDFDEDGDIIEDVTLPEEINLNDHKILIYSICLMPVWCIAIIIFMIISPLWGILVASLIFPSLAIGLSNKSDEEVKK